jgi:uncharacterized protein DUF7009
MKLRFGKNSLRLRVNRLEVERLATGQELTERISFAGGATLDYILIPSAVAQRAAEFDGKVIRVTAPLGDWARGSEIGFYFAVEPGLKVAVEKDLECVDGREDEKDPYAYPRTKTC